MTKKSFARQKRDEFRKKYGKPEGWKELAEIYKSFKEEWAKPIRILNEILNENKENFIYIPRKDLFKKSLNCLSSDYKRITEDLDKNYALHKDKKPIWNSEDDFFLGIQLGENYTTLNSQYQALITPSLKFISNQLDYALFIKDEIKKAESKETSTETQTEVVI